jgi:AcrR family transcriptional regulator
MMYMMHTSRMYDMSTSARSTYHHGQLRQTLVALALDAVEQGSPEDVSLRGLAERAGVSGMAPYRHFPDKAALLEAVAEAGFDALRQELVAVDNPADARAALLAFAGVYVRFAVERPGLFRLMFAGAPPTPSEGLADRPSIFGLFMRRIEALVPPHRQHDAFFACWSLAHGLASLLAAGRVRQPPSDPAALAERIGRMLLDGIEENRA